MMYKHSSKLKKINNFLYECAKKVLRNWRLKKYYVNGRKPWSTGYSDHKEKYLKNMLNDERVLDLFRGSKTLPNNYGFRLDERVVEYPWLFSRMNQQPTRLLDAGSALNFNYLLNSRWLADKSVVIYNLSPEQIVMQDNISYIYGDLRHTIFRNDLFDTCVCISTIEHVGMNNQMLYSNKKQYFEDLPESFLDAVKELKRVLKPGGRLFLTVPYGTYQNLGWLQQFDNTMVTALIRLFGGHLESISYFKYHNNGWQVSNAVECENCRYFDIHNQKTFEPDYVASARAVACIELVK